MTLWIMPDDKSTRVLAFPPQKEIKTPYSTRKVVLITSVILGIVGWGYYLETKKEGKKIQKLIQSWKELAQLHEWSTSTYQNS